jgi:hypothetical protein
MSKFNMTLEEYNKILVKQNGACAICGKIPQGVDRYREAKSLCVDHNHRTKKNRGLLCDLCNRALGQFQEDIKILKSAIKYLGEYS